ncbi:DUF6281 family protein [Streptomyces montanisoli]|uniref:Lipoprotein n=1 Tax=Streptomyces montanisoli TaxID=2798581 RepID=A0A940MJI9_9ACTN|nr:DUF6281 family protein [Streptomyces montanisoli]MBP0462197.1 hypothetical protein [Streptomyces montanisoli]
MVLLLRARIALQAAGAVALLALAGSGCSSTTSGHGGGDCAWVLEFDGRTYQGTGQRDTTTSSPVHHQGEALGKGTLKGCDDGPGQVVDQAVLVYRIAGVPTEQAVISANDVIGVSDPAHMPDAVRRLLGIPPSPGPT